MTRSARPARMTAIAANGFAALIIESELINAKNMELMQAYENIYYMYLNNIGTVNLINKAMVKLENSLHCRGISLNTLRERAHNA